MGATFVEDEGVRADEHVKGLCLVCLDIDHPNEKQWEAGCIDYANQLCESPETIADRLHPWNYVAYETASSKPGAKCLRIIVAMQEWEPEEGLPGSPEYIAER